MWTALPPAEYYEVIRLPRHIRWAFPFQYFSTSLPGVPPQRSRFQHRTVSGFPLVWPKELSTIRRDVRLAGTSEVSQVLNASLSACQALRTPTDPPVSHHDETFALASSALKLSPSVLIALTRLYQTSGCAVTLPAYRVPCVRFTCFVRCWALPPHMQHSVRVVG